MADKQYCSKPYRQITRGLRINRGPGRGDTVSVRPHQGNARDGTLVYLDSDEAPTLISFDEYDQADVASLLRLGAIQEYILPRRTESAKAVKEVASGEASRPGA